MSCMSIKTIACTDSHTFEEDVNEFLDKKENLIIHEKTVFGITQETYRGRQVTMYSVIFYGELG